ncbi:hypothetical protein HYH03_017365 [Edaphochlamys debaryana]|uniref:MYND-type domain-containing protein n=1 Tax=Edaphochlamys debaryana TaxID=47281 RepID=A0A835XGQ2_9CHLO|nr:hypothetical protein HYH03_017365 [Edaphochlamys debaryana]|eukprot:KAG2483768.1 hypothetical protein HYH03_017365 [Edaphochlamys debaryana]
MATIRELWRTLMDRSDSVRRVYMSGKREELQQWSQELGAAETALEQCRKGLGVASRLQWLEGCAAAGVPAWTLRHLRALPAPIAAACRTTASYDTLLIAVDTSQLAAHSAGLCLKAYIEALVGLQEDFDHNAPHIRTHAAPLTSADFLSALSRAASTAADLARRLQLPATQAHIAAHGAASTPQTLADMSANASSKFTSFAGYCLNLASSLLGKEVGRAGAGPLPPLVPRLAAALRDSQLAAGVAQALMTSPGPSFTVRSGHGRGGAGGSRSTAQPGVPVWPTVMMSVRALATLTDAAVHLQGFQGAAALGASSALGAALAHPHVAGLRLALLQTLWEQGGMGPGPGGPCNLEDEGDPGLPSHHQHSLVATLGVWQEGRHGVLRVPDDARLPPEPGVPPGLQLARAAERTAEAMCRLCRGQGLAGAYTAEQRRRMSRVESALWRLLPYPQPRCPRSPDELPHWAGASAWVVAAALEGLEAASAEQECPGEEEATVTDSSAGVSLAAVLVDGVQAVISASDLLATAPHVAGGPRRQPAPRGPGRLPGPRPAPHYTAADRAAAPGACERDRQLAEALVRLLPYAGDLLSALASCGLAAACDVGGAALTLAKRASLVARGLEAAQATEDGAPGAVPVCLRGPKQLLPGCLTVVLADFAALLNGAAGPWAGGGAPGGELEAYFFQAAGRLAAQLGADAAAYELPSAGSEEYALLSSARIGAAAVIGEGLDQVSALCSAPGSLAVSRLLACQPHRLIAAACKLLLAWRSAGEDPEEVDQRGELQGALSLAALRLAAHPSLSARVRRWLVPAGTGQAAAGMQVADGLEGEAEASGVKPEAAQAEAQEGRGAEAPATEPTGAEAERGCLEQAWSEGWRSYDCEICRLADGSSFSLPLTLLRLAQGGGSGGRGAREEVVADAAFRSGAMELQAWAESTEAGGSQVPLQLTEDLLRGPGDASNPGAVRAAAAVLRAPLPPPLAAPPEGRALPKLRVCGFPGCASFGGRSEAGLALRQCGGCRAVRYCGPGCQRAHWREGHRDECGALAEAAEARLWGASGDGQ